MLWNQLSGIFKVTGLLNAIKDLINLSSNNPHKHPMMYVITFTMIGGFFIDNSDLKYFTCSEILVFLILIIFFYSYFNSFYPWIKSMIKNFFSKKQAREYFPKLTNEQKDYLLTFFPNPNVTRLICVDRDDYSLRELIEYKVLIPDDFLSFDEYTNYAFTNINIAKHILKIIRKNDLLEIWKSDKEARDSNIKESESESESIPF